MTDTYRIKEEKKEYPWGRFTIVIFSSDVLTRQADGHYMKHTGVGCFGIQIPDEDIILFEEAPPLFLG